MSLQEAGLACYRFADKSASFRSIGQELHRNHETIARAIRTILPPDITDWTQPSVNPSNDVSAFVDTNGQFQRHYILWKLLSEPSTSVRALASDMVYMPFVLKKTRISKLISEMHIACTYTTKTRFMTAKHREYHAAWSRAIGNSDLFTLPWLFTDEVSIQATPNRRSVYRVPGIFLDSYCQEYQVQPTKVMLWGGISLNDKSKLMKTEGHIDQYKYQQMLLDSGVFTDMDALYGPSGWLFMDDGAPVIERIQLRQFSH
jgi:hypothetical protein